MDSVYTFKCKPLKHVLSCFIILYNFNDISFVSGLVYAHMLF
jgi:hypothetical protein